MICPVVCPVICPMFTNTQMSVSCVQCSITRNVLVLPSFLYPIKQNVCLGIFREFAQLYCLLQHMDNVPKCSKSTLCNIQKYPKYSKSIQTMYPVHSSESSQQHKHFIYIYIHLNIIFQDTIAFLIASEY